MKKATWIKIAATGVAAVPPVVVLLINMPVFIQNTGKEFFHCSVFIYCTLATLIKHFLQFTHVKFRKEINIRDNFIFFPLIFLLILCHLIYFTIDQTTQLKNRNTGN